MAAEEKNQQQTDGRKGEAQDRASTSEPGLMPWMSSPFTIMRRLADEMDRAFGSPGRPSADWQPGFGTRGEWSPKLEMFERDGNLHIHADLPGLQKNDVSIEVHNNNLIIEGERNETRTDEKKGYYHSERSYGRFYRRIRLPENVDTENISATLNNGVLEVTMPSPERSESRGSKRIEIQ